MDDLGTPGLLRAGKRHKRKRPRGVAEPRVAAGSAHIRVPFVPARALPPSYEICRLSARCRKLLPGLRGGCARPWSGVDVDLGRLDGEPDLDAVGEVEIGDRGRGDVDVGGE